MNSDLESRRKSKIIETELHSLTSSLSDWLSVDSVARSKLRLFLQLPGLSSKTESLPTLLTERRNRARKSEIGPIVIILIQPKWEKTERRGESRGGRDLHEIRTSTNTDAILWVLTVACGHWGHALGRPYMVIKSWE